MTTEADDQLRVRRLPDRARYELQDVKAILAEGTIAHVGTIRDGLPIVIPMFYAVDGNDLLLHGAPAAGVLRRAGEPIEICATITIVDGLVLARSAFHHSMNYRSVVVIGVAEPVEDAAAKTAALDLFADKIVPGRQAELRPTTEKEIRGTSVLRLSLDRSSAKVRTGPPVDDEKDYDFGVWAGVIPVGTTFGEPVPDERLKDGIELPISIQRLFGS